MKRMWLWLSLISLLIAGCRATETSVPSNDLEKETDFAQMEEDRVENEGKAIAPLTGLAVDEAMDHPIVMVMLNNHPKARPQTGLNRADIVFEVLAEGEITRFAAFYHSETMGTIGPVRSARPYYLDLAEGFHAVVAHAGGSPAAKERFDQPGYPHLDGISAGESYFWREDFRQAPHNLYTSMEKLLQGAKDNGWADHEHVPQLLFSATDEDIAVDEAAHQIDIIYGPLYDIGYTYDAAAERYTRFTQGEEQIDRETNTSLTMENILVIEAPHRVVDDQGRREIELTGSGEGWLFQKGSMREIEWRYEEGFPRPYADGQELLLVPGKTWVNVVPKETEVTFQ